MMEALSLEMQASAAGHEKPEFKSLFREHGGYVWRILRHLGVQEADVDDACQEVFLVAHRKLSEFEGRSSSQSWLYGIARRVASEHRRRTPRRREAPLDQANPPRQDPDQVESVKRVQARQLMERILHELPEEQRITYALFEIEQLPMQQVADILGCPLQTAYSRLHAARKHVHAAVRELRGSGS